ncbi:MAG: UDP-N-acetylmuramoyl-L-alanine--D-glutamate ligase [Alphaproteobacteria bacterium]|nr:UDP-N-acetylmuramoyl-L-alanine--D-glutamate ligase [Alphaproteobacteria bacterium]
MTLSELEDKRLAIWGLGKEGMSSYRALRRLFPTKDIMLVDRVRPPLLPNEPHIDFMSENEFESRIADLDVVIKAPGISLYHPLVAKLNQHNVTLTSATNIWFAEPRRARVIAITGSAGKSTTAALLSHILNHIGLRTLLGGNIGTPLLDLDNDADYYVVELSSYQTADLEYPPDIAVLLNLFPEHIDWHRSHAQYFTDKCHLIRVGAKAVILNRHDPKTAEWLRPAPKGTLWFNDNATIHSTSEFIVSGKNIVGRLRDIHLPGDHNRSNICAALTVCRELNLDLKECFKWAASFRGLPHRLENLGGQGGQTYINDSIATTPEATLAALSSLSGKNITLLAGGQDRHQDYSQLAEYIRDHPEITVITAYESGAKLNTALKGIGVVSTMEAAFDLRQSVIRAQEITPQGGFILLSPAAPSYDSFKNFEQRGEFFKIFSRSKILTS